MTSRRVVHELVERGDDDALRNVVVAAKADDLDDEDVADLARVLAASGASLRPGLRSADIASTGGPSSLSTLICPLLLCARGLSVPKLAVRGRPAGGIDVLETIPGFQPALDASAAQAAMSRTGYVHLLADEKWAPLDARLFALRQLEGAQTVPALVIASILAKKLAAGATGAGLEVRIAPHGNFGADDSSTRRNAARYAAVAKLLGLEPVCFLTDGTRPFQPYIGRGEALVALAEVLDGQATAWLSDHYDLCLRMTDALADAMGVDTSRAPESALVREAHDALLRVHGTDGHAFESRVEDVRAAPRTIVRAKHEGTVAYNLGRLRELLVERQRAESIAPDGPPADPAGVILESPVGSRVAAGDVVMSVRVPEGEERLATDLASCMQLSSQTLARERRSTLEII